jgi:hypothetical protein
MVVSTTPGSPGVCRFAVAKKPRDQGCGALGFIAVVTFAVLRDGNGSSLSCGKRANRFVLAKN